MKNDIFSWAVEHRLLASVGLLLVVSFTLYWVKAVPHIFLDVAEYDEFITVKEPQSATRYLGQLNNFPHTYSFTITQPQPFYAQLSAPVSATEAEALPKFSAILVKQEKRGVTEIARVLEAEVSWQTDYEITTASTYRQGPTLEAALEPGEYLFEVNTPDNQGKYQLTIGKYDRSNQPNPLAVLKNIYLTKVFLDESIFSVFLSPFYLVFGLTIVLIGWLWLYRERHIYA